MNQSAVRRATTLVCVILSAVAFAVPALASHTLTITQIGEGFYAVDPVKALYEDDEVVSLRATPDTPFTFVGWEGTGSYGTRERLTPLPVSTLPRFAWARRVSRNGSP